MYRAKQRALGTPSVVVAEHVANFDVAQSTQDTKHLQDPQDEHDGDDGSENVAELSDPVAEVA
jgi:hypothetical protein